MLNVTTAEGNSIALFDPTAIPFRVDANGKWKSTGDYVLLDNMLDYNAPVALQQADTVLYTDQACTTTLKAIVYTCMVQPTINQATTMQIGALANQVSGVFASASADEWTSTYLFGKPKAMTGVVLDKDDYTLTSKTIQDFPISVELFCDVLNEEWKRDFALYIIGKKTPATRDLESETIPTYVAPIVYLPCICVEPSSSVSASTPCDETCTEPAVTITLAGITKTDAGDITEVNGKFTLANVNGGSMYTGGGSGFRISATKTAHGWQITVIKGSVGNYGGTYYATTYNYLPTYDMQCTGTEAENGLRESGIIIGGVYNAGYGGTALVECEYCACKPAETETVTVSFRDVVWMDDRYALMGWNPNQTFVLGDLEASSDLSTFWNCHATAGTWKKFYQYGMNGGWVEIPPPYTTANRDAPVVAIIASVY